MKDLKTAAMYPVMTNTPNQKKYEKMCLNYLFIVDCNLCDVCVEYRWKVALWKLVFFEHPQKTSFAAGSVSNDHYFLVNCRHFCKHNIKPLTQVPLEKILNEDVKYNDY